MNSERFRGFSHVVTLQGVNFTICHAAHIRCNFQLTRERALAAALGCAKRHAFLRASFSPIPKTSFTKPVFAPLEDFTPALEIISDGKSSPESDECVGIHATEKATDLDEMYHTDASFDKIPDMKYYLSARPDGALGTAIYSNVGRYPYALDHASAKTGETLTIDALQVVNPAIPIGYQICFYTTGTVKLCYSVQSRFDKVETTKIFDQWVELCEKCHEFGDEPAISHLPTPSHISC